MKTVVVVNKLRTLEVNRRIESMVVVLIPDHIIWVYSAADSAAAAAAKAWRLRRKAPPSSAPPPPPRPRA